ncbi:MULTISPECIES: HXXEE domain-containing protein [unclassified Streptomyces]|uniref:HXXEE domain-containing protein n=1 Tax=unclassified Streptomyces TaxID=2593676 RepID=UPI001BEA0339|nr:MULTISPECIES: HXXEE domain-containing protein [unclassified Streptomyces]MBT2405109.1 HXXEE domain-containing protein [Streptomyces sp. ISL-21]MBT2458718.1 HXXEE domain-containing protein [Streptomyces sp. ISL-86]MBT2610877.1 HXXEE domain-containing protein [Streptomyces sp. ISL-87]
MSESNAPAKSGAALTTATLGLLAAWAVHDLEEVATMARWSRTRVPVLRERHPRVPDRVWQRFTNVDGREFATAVGVMGLVVAAAAADGHRTGGRSAFYQTALNGFGLHGLVHLGLSAVTRGYTPGVVTSPLIVVPFSLWARGRLRRAGVLRPTRAGDLVKGLGLAAAATAGAHAAARRIR